MKKEIKKKRKKVESGEKNYFATINYLIDSYFSAPNETFSIRKIEEELEIESCLLKPLLLNLCSKKIIKKKNKDEYIITFDGFNELMIIRNKHRTFATAIVTLGFGITKFAIDTLSIVFDNNKAIIIILYFSIMILGSKYIKKVW